MNYKYLILSVLLIGLYTSTAIAQKKKYTVAVFPFKYDETGKGFYENKAKKDRGTLLNALYWLDEKASTIIYGPEDKQNNTDSETLLKDLQDKTVKRLLEDRRLQVVERSNWSLLELEKELQKQEEFIEGKTVEQGKGIGAEYVVIGALSKNKTSVSLSLLKVGDQSLVTRVNTDASLVEDGVRDLIVKAFPRTLKLIRKSREVKNVNGVIMAGGFNSKIPKSSILGVKRITEVVVNGEKLEKEEYVGKLYVLKHLNDNFTFCRIITGKSKIRKTLEKGGKLYCYVIKKRNAYY